MNSPADPSHPGASVAGSDTPTGDVGAAAGPIGDLTTNVPRAGEAEHERPEIPEIPSIEDVYWKRGEVYTLAEKTEAWEKAAGLVQDYSDEMIKRWNEEINAYLTFAGLFSAVLTTFNVQTYSLLHPSTPDPSVVALQQISAQLVSFSLHPPFLNSTHKPITQDAAPTTSNPVPRWVVWLNGLWFSGLILSLAAATLGILVKQWTKEYTSGAAGKSRPVARLRQHRLNNLKRWHVENLVDTIPILLLLALACFLAGMLILLWNLHHTVAAVASVLAGLLGLFTITTTLLPLFRSSCAYLTPQARGLYAVWQPRCLVYWMHARTASWRRDTAGLLIGIPSRFLSAALRLGKHLHRASQKLSRRVITLTQHVASPPESWKEHKQTWQRRERSTIGKVQDNLDKQILLEAYTSTLHPDALSAASVCLMDLDYNFVVDYFRQLHRSTREHFGTMADSERGPLGRGNQQQLLWLHIVLCAEFIMERRDSEALSDDEQAALGVYLQCAGWPSNMKAADAQWALSTIDAFVESRGTPNSLRTILPHNHHLRWERYLLLRNALRRKEPLSGVSLTGVSGAYRQVRRTESLLQDDPQSDGAKAALREYLSSILAFLQCNDEVLIINLPSDSLETVCAYTQDVLTELTRTLLRVFADDRVQSLRETVDAYALFRVMWTLVHQTSDEVLQCIPDDLVQDVLRMADTLSKPYDYNNNHWRELTQQYASELKANVIRVKGEPAGEMSPNTARSPTGPSGMEAVASTSAARSSRQPALDEPPFKSAAHDGTSPAGPSGVEVVASTAAEDSSQQSARGDSLAMYATSAADEERRDTPPSGRDAASSAGFEASPQVPAQHHGLATPGVPAPDVEDHQEAASLTSGATVSSTSRGVSSIHPAPDDAAGTSTPLHGGLEEIRLSHQVPATSGVLAFDAENQRQVLPLASGAAVSSTSRSFSSTNSAPDNAAGTSTTAAYGGLQELRVAEPHRDEAPSIRSDVSPYGTTQEHSAATTRTPAREVPQERYAESSPREESAENP